MISLLESFDKRRQPQLELSTSFRHRGHENDENDVLTDGELVIARNFLKK